MELITSTARAWLEAISRGLAIGPPACSFRLAARPSQNCATARLEFSTVGELIGPSAQLCPMEVGRLSLPPVLRLWQELEEMKPDIDRRGSNHSFLPSSTCSGCSLTSGSIGLMSSVVRRSAWTWALMPILAATATLSRFSRRNAHYMHLSRHGLRHVQLSESECLRPGEQGG